MTRVARVVGCCVVVVGGGGNCCGPYVCPVLDPFTE